MDLFDWNYYIENNKDLKENGVYTKEQAILHWNEYGKKEGRPSKFLKDYTQCNIINIQNLLSKNIINKSDAWDLIISLINEPDEIEYGNFDWEFYIKRNKKLFKHNIKNKKDAIKHWNKIGKYDKNFKYIEDDFYLESITKDNFDWIYYIKNNLDLIKNNILNGNMAWEHWCNYGKYERRPFKCRFDKNITYETFDWIYYIDNNLDLSNKGLTQEGAWQHWIYYGRNEDRKIKLYNDNESLNNELNDELNDELNNELNNNEINNEFISNNEKKNIEDYLDICND